MQCNIDARGRMARRNGGVSCCVLGAAFVGLGFFMPYRAALIGAGAALIVAGLFQLFEAWKGWCAVRAMGFKTPI